MDLSLAIAVHASSFVSRLINLKALFFSLSLSLSSPFSIASIHLELINYYSVNFFFLFLFLSLYYNAFTRQFLHIYIYIHGSKGRVVHSLSIILEAITFLRYTIFTVTNGSSRLVARPSIDRGTGLEGRPLSARNPNKSSHPPVTIGECRFLPPLMRKNHLSPSNDRQMK